MSKSLKRVSIEAAELKLNINIIKLRVETKTAKDAAMALKCEIDQMDDAGGVRRHVASICDGH